MTHPLKRYRFVLMLGCALGAGPVFGDATTPTLALAEHTPQRVAFTGATVISAPGKRLEQATILIDQGRIRALGKNIKIPGGTRIVDASQNWIYPGFIDMYSDYGMPESKAKPPRRGRGAPKYRVTRAGGRYWNPAIKASQNWVDRFQSDAKAAKSYRKLGFAALQSAALDGLFRGRGVLVSLADSASGEVIYRAHAQAFASFDKGSSSLNYPNSLMGAIALMRQALSDARWYVRARRASDLSMLDGAEVAYDADLEALAAIPAQGFLFATADVQSELRAHRLLTEFHLPGVILGNGEEYTYLDDIKASGRSYILPLTFPKAPKSVGTGDALAEPLAKLRRWERAPTNPGVLAAAGIRFALTRHGLKKADQFWPNLRKAVAYGLSPEDALAALTTAPAAMLGVADDIGALRPGMRANLVVATGDLFGGDAAVAANWIDGKRYAVIDPRVLRFSGNYDLKIREQSLQLEIKRKGDNGLEASLSRDKDKVETSATLERDALKLSFQKALPGAEKPLRMVLYADSKGLHGQVYAGVAPGADLLAIRVPAKTENKKPATEPSVALVSHLTRPLLGFGRERKPARENVLLRHATVWTSAAAGMLEDTDVLVKDGRFGRIGKNLKAPKGYRVIEAEGKFVSAGIIDEHSHIAISRGVNEGSEAVTSEVRIGDVVNAEDINIYRGLAGGKTTSQLLHGSANPIGGQAQVIKLRWGEDAQGLKYRKAPPTIKFALGENVKQSNWGDQFTKRYPQTRMGVETLIRDAFAQARRYAQKQSRWAGLSKRARRNKAPPRVDYRLQALAEVLQGKRFVHVHSYVASEILMLMRLAEAEGFRIQTFTHILEGYKVAPEMAAHGTTASTFADWWAYKFEVYDAIPQNTCLLNRAGVVTSVNSDSGDLQRRLNVEAAKSVTYCGMSQRDAWNMVTINPAKQLRIEKWTGSIEVGKDADFVIWNANPLSVYARAEQTWIEGRKYFDRAEQAAKETAITAERSALLAEARKAHKAGFDKATKKPKQHAATPRQSKGEI